MVNYKSLGRHMEGWGGARDYGQAQGVVGRRTGTWAGTGSDGEAYGPIGRHRE